MTYTAAKLLLIVILLGSWPLQGSQNIGVKSLYRTSGNSLINNNILDNQGSGIYSLFIQKFDKITVLNSMYFSMDSIEAARGSSHSIKNIYFYTYRGLIQFDFEIDHVNNVFLIGRDFYDFGVAKNNRLFFSRESRSFDLLRWHYNYKNISGGMAGIQLENIGSAKRYLAVHTFQVSVPDKFKLLCGESVLYSGPGRSIEFQYFNPFIVWTPETYNVSTGDANAFLFTAFELNYFPTWQFWGELLVDDYQINREKKGDLEPNEIGLVAGVQKSGFPFVNSIAWLEYTRITNRTYQTPKPEETYTHRDYPIGHYLGNDFDLLQFHYEQRLAKSLSVSYFKPSETKLYFDIGYLRDGANGLDTPFDTPWEDSTVTMETGYSEPFPTGPVTYFTELEIGFDFLFKNGSYINTGLAWQRKGFQGKVENDYSLVIQLSLILSKKFNY